MKQDALEQQIETARRHLLTLERRAKSPSNRSTVLHEALVELAQVLDALRDSQARTRSILDTAVDGIITIDERGVIDSFNPAAEHLFGYPATEAIGQNVEILMPAPDSAQHDDYIARYLRTGVNKVIGIGREVVGQRKDGTMFPIDLAVSEVFVGDRRMFTGIVRDATERKRAERRLAVQYAATRVLAGSPSLQQAGPTLLQAICEAIGWELGELWRVDTATNQLHWDAAWHRPALDATEFVALSQRTTFTPGNGLPGHVWAKGEPAWIQNVGNAACFNRFASAAKLGLHGASAFPIRAEGTVLGVMVFFGHETREPDADWLETLDALGSQIGDFIERKRAEEATRESEARLRNIITGSPDGIIIVDQHGRVRFVNPAAETLLGRPARALIGEAFGFPLVVGEATEVDVLRPNAPAAVADMRLSETEWQGERVWLVTLRNITDRKLAERAVHDSEARFHAFMSNSPAVGFIKDEEGHYLYINPTFERLFHVTAAQLRGKTDFDLWPPDVARRVRANDAVVLESNASTELVENVPTPDGTLREWMVFKFPVIDADGRRLLGGVALDITERKRAEAKLRDLEQLAQQRERLADIGAIAAQIAHDLGNPLAGVSMQAQLVLRRASRDGTQPISTIVQPLERILAEVRRLDSLVKEFMEFSREQRLDLKHVHLPRFLDGLADLWRPVAAAREIALTVETPEHIPPLKADEEKLRRVFDNLLKNAIEAINRGPGRVGIEVTLPAPESVCIAVADTGPGIPETVQVFRLFETTKAYGSGIGLAVAQQIVQAHHGTIGFTRLQPNGTVFRVELPRGGPFA